MSRNSSGSWGGVLKVSVVQRLEAGECVVCCGPAWLEQQAEKGRLVLRDHPPGLTLWTSSFLY